MPVRARFFLTAEHVVPGLEFEVRGRTGQAMSYVVVDEPVPVSFGAVQATVRILQVLGAGCEFVAQLHVGERLD